MTVARTPYVDAVAVGGADPTGATDSTFAINNCLSQYGAVSLQPGTYRVDGNGIFLSGDQTLIGANPHMTVIRHASATGNVINITGGQGGRLLGVCLDRAVPAINGGNGIGYFNGAPPPLTNYFVFRDVYVQNQWNGVNLGGAIYGTFDNVQCDQNYNDGWNFVGNVPIQWVLKNCGAQMNNNWGFQFVAANGYCPVGQMETITAFANGVGGMNFQGSPGNTINDVRLMNYNGSGNGGTDLNFQTYGEHNVIIGGLIEGAGYGSGGMCGRGLGIRASNSGYGVLATMSNTELTIIGQQIRGCANSGIGTRGAFGSLIISGNQISGNNVAATAGDAAIFLSGTVSVAALITGNGGSGGGLQRYGIYNAMPPGNVVVGDKNALRGTIANYAGNPMTGANV